MSYCTECNSFICSCYKPLEPIFIPEPEPTPFIDFNAYKPEPLSKPIKEITPTLGSREIGTYDSRGNIYSPLGTSVPGMRVGACGIIEHGGRSTGMRIDSMGTVRPIANFTPPPIGGCW